MRMLKWTVIAIGGFLALMAFIGMMAGVADPNYCFRMEAKREQIVRSLEQYSVYRNMTAQQQHEAMMNILRGYAVHGDFNKKCLTKYAMPPLPNQKVEDVSHLYRRH